MKILRDDLGFVIRGERFVSYQEVQCFRYLRWLGLSLDEMGHEFRVGRWSFDFFPRGKVFWEHHPIYLKSGEDLYQYGKRRRLTLNAFGYSKTSLVVSDVIFKNQWEVCDMMNDYDVDFKQGKVKGDPTICFVRDYGGDWGGLADAELTPDNLEMDAPIILAGN